MMKLIALVAIICAATLVSASVRAPPSSSPSEIAQHVLYTRSEAPADWIKMSPAPVNSHVEFTIALKQRNLDILDRWFTEVSDPQHKNYQEFKTIDEISSLVAPKPEETKQVMRWLASNGIHHKSVQSFGDALDVKTTVKQAARLFNTKFFTFRHSKTGAKVVRSFGSYSVPAHLKNLVEIVVGVSEFPIPHLQVSRPNAANDYGAIPQTAWAQYQITQEQRKIYAASKKRGGRAVPATSQAVIEFQQQDFANSDLVQFGQGVNINIQPLPNATIVGPNDPTQPGLEPSLDIEMVAGVNEGATNWFWLEAGEGWLYQFGVHFFGTEDVPQVNSISYGWWEGDQCTIDGPGCSQLGVDSEGYVQRVNTEFQKIGLRGISLISASGDSGANGRTNGDCSVAQLRPSFPGSSPYITSVGATELINTNNLATQPSICGAAGYECVSTGSEQAVSYAISNFASGGGFSNITMRPSYQNAAVNAYLASGVQLPPASYYNAAGRGHPDVAAMGHNLLIVQGGQAQPVGGTSASSPIFAAVIALLNVASQEETGKPLGFLNPFLYQMAAAHPSAFHDITVGDNTCTEQGCQPGVCEGFYAAKGWDPVTGLGTPNFTQMLAYLKSQAAKRRAAHKKH